ncbi:hypothetical protein CHISP_2000 [Chitinispirillum alkaliphilum]|nr:hypothetical protein CHISP_2000 [Chitinispirillum alkaliphilum]
MICKIIKLPFWLVSRVLALAAGVVKILLSTVAGLVGFLFNHVTGTIFGALIGLLLGRKHVGPKFGSAKKKKA